MNLNKVLLIGRLTADPQLRSTAGGQAVANFSLATNRVWVDKTGKRGEETEFHNIVVWGRQAEVVGQFLKKGQLVHVEGRLQTRSWQDREGHTRKTTEIVAERVQFGPKAMGTGAPGPSSPLGENLSSGSKETFSSLSSSSAGEVPPIPEINIDDDGGIRAEDIPF